MITKDIKLEFKQISEQGQFEGYAAAFGNEDLGGDIILPGAFKKTISESGARPLLWHHQLSEPIGVVQASEDVKGLLVNGSLNLDVQRAREAHSLIKQGAVKGLSVGFEAVTKDYKSGVRYLREVKLHEVSLTPVPMNPEARVRSVKSLEDLEQILNEVISFKSDAVLSADKKALIEQAQKTLSALLAAKAPEAAKQDEIAPEVLHAASDRIEKLLRGEL
jgi:HK97 family phage prohead protease